MAGPTRSRRLVSKAVGEKERWMAYKRAVSLIVLFLAASFAAMSASQADKVDDFVKAEMMRHNIPRLSMGVVMNGETKRAKGCGLANVKLKAPATADTIFQSGSVGKQFTATLAMMMVEEGRMSLDDRISKYISNAPATWKDITLRHLL